MSIVTISRGSFSGAQAVAEEVARRLDVPCLSREVVVEAASAAGVSERVLQDVLDRPPSFWERNSGARELYLLYVQAALTEQAARGGFVYHGHDGQLLLTELTNVLRVRVVAPMTFRIHAVTERLGIAEEKARRHIAKIDRQREKWARFLYDVEWSDPQRYDLVVNLDRLDPDAAGDLIAQLACTEPFARTPATQRDAANLALSRAVAAEIAHQTEVPPSELTTEADGGTVVLRGRVRTDDLRRAVCAVAEQVPGVQNVRCEITIPVDALGR